MSQMTCFELIKLVEEKLDGDLEGDFEVARAIAISAYCVAYPQGEPAEELIGRIGIRALRGFLLEV